MVTKPHDGVRVVGSVVHYVRADGRSVLAEITALGAGDLVDLKIRGHGDKRIELPGTAGHHASTPDHDDFLPTTSFELRWDVEVDDVSVTLQTIMSQWAAGGDQRFFFLHTDNEIAGPNDPVWLLDMGDSDGVFHEAWYSAPHGLADFQRGQFRLIYTMDIGGGNRLVEYFKRGPITPLHDDFDPWEPLAIVPPGSRSTAASFKNVATPLYIAANNNGSGNRLNGKLYRSLLYIDGVLQGDPDPKLWEIGDSDTDTAVDSAGRTWTLNGATTVVESDDEVFTDIDLSSDPSDTDVWYKSSRRHP